MKCLLCGAELQPGTTECPVCGTSILPQIEDTSPYTDDMESIAYIDQRPSALTSSALPVKSTVPFHSRSSQPLAPALAPQLPQRQVGQQSGILPATAALLVVLALLILGSASGLLTYVTIGHPSELKAQATAVTQSILRSQAQATATATAYLPQNVYNQITSTKPLISESLDGQSSSLWVNRRYGASGCAFKNAAYHILIVPKDPYSYCPALGGSYSNLIFQIQMTMLNGLNGGLTFHTFNQNSPFPGYLFTISRTGLYGVSVLNTAQQGNVLAFGRSSAIHTGLRQANLIAVMVRDGTISLFANRQLLISIKNNTYDNGAIGLLGDNLPQSNIDIAFNNAQIWDLP